MADEMPPAISVAASEAPTSGDEFHDAADSTPVPAAAAPAEAVEAAREERLGKLDAGGGAAAAAGPEPEPGPEGEEQADEVQAKHVESVDTSILANGDFFESMPLLPQHFKDMLRRMDYKEPTIIQKLIIDKVFEWRQKQTGYFQVMAKAPTGSGKTLCFMLAILDQVLGDDGKLKPDQPQAPAAICMLPTRELVVQMDDYLEKFELHSMGGVTKRRLVKGDKPQDVREHIVFGTPGMLINFMEAAIKKRISFDLSNVAVFVLDEADNLVAGRMDIQTQRVKSAIDKARKKGNYHNLFMSATFPPKVEKYIKKLAPKVDIVRPDSYLDAAVRDGVRQTTCEVEGPELRALALVKLFPQLARAGGSCLIFLNDKEGAHVLANHLDYSAQVFTELQQSGITVGVLSSKNTPEERDIAFRNFRDGKMKVLVATDVLCRGINIPSVNFVVHYDIPNRNGKADFETYLHRCGRCARFTNKGVSLVFTMKSHPQVATIQKEIEGKFGEMEVVGADSIEAELAALGIDGDLD